MPEQKEPDKLVTIEHYVDNEVCYELVGDETTAYYGSYAGNFYAMLPYTILQMCEFMSQFVASKNENAANAFELYWCECEFDAYKISVPECVDMYYIFDADGKILAAKIDMHGSTSTTLMIGQYNVTIPVFPDCKSSDGMPKMDYLGV